MRNTLAYSASVLAALLAMSGCGGSSSSGDANTGTAYYLDSAVSGIHYVCGSEEGDTNAQGAFTFEIGQGCTFYLDAMQLRTVAGDALYDGAQIVEGNVTIGRMLQVLDTDGNAGNGITVSPEVIRAMTEHNITTLPDTDAEIEHLYQVLQGNVANYNGTAVSEGAAMEHMDETAGDALNALLAGQTFYVPGEENGSPLLTEATVNATATHVHGYRLVGPDRGAISDSGITINGNKVTFTDGGFYLEYTGSTKAYLQMDEYQEDQAVPVRWYHDKAEAETYLGTLGNSLAGLIVGKTLYMSSCGVPTEMTFEANATLRVNDSEGSASYTYEISQDELVIRRLDGTVKGDALLAEVTAKYVTLQTKNSTETMVLYFNKADAEAAAPDNCAAATSLEGAWIERTQNSTRVYVVMDGAGVISEFGAFGVASPAGTYQVDAEGNMTMAMTVNGTAISGSGTVLSETSFTVTFPTENGDYTATFDKVTNRAACEGTWDVSVDNVLNAGTDQPPVNHFTLSVNNQGVITDMTGFGTPVSGKFYCEGSSMVAHVTAGTSTDDAYQYSEMTFYGTISQAGISGYGVVDNGSEDDPDLQLTFTKGGDGNTSGNAYTMSYDLVAGQTFYVYGYNDAGEVDGGHVILTFGADGTTLSAQGFDGTSYGSGDVTIADNALVLSAGGETHTMKALRLVDGVMYTMDISLNGGYPEVMAKTMQDDNGTNLLQKLEASYLDDGSFTQASIVGTYYSVILDNSDERGGCGAEWTLGSDGALTARYRDAQGTAATMQGTYSVSGNLLTGTMEGQSYPSMRMISNDFDGLTVAGEKYFSNRDDAVAFAALLGNANCDNFYPAR